MRKQYYIALVFIRYIFGHCLSKEGMRQLRLLRDALVEEVRLGAEVWKDRWNPKSLEELNLSLGKKISASSSAAS
jgi:hypothetical protein